MRRRSQSSILSALLVSADNRKWENRSVASLTAVPFRQKISHLFTQIKRHGALFAKGWLIALQFEARRGRKNFKERALNIRLPQNFGIEASFY